jgi:hypothetical protein
MLKYYMQKNKHIKIRNRESFSLSKAKIYSVITPKVTSSIPEGKGVLKAALHDYSRAVSKLSSIKN